MDYIITVHKKKSYWRTANSSFLVLKLMKRSVYKHRFLENYFCLRSRSRSQRKSILLYGGSSLK